MKRSPLIWIANVLQLLLGLALACLTIYLLMLTRSPETLREVDASDTVHGLLIGAVVLGVPGAIALIGVLGLWKRRFWGWALSLSTDVGVLAVLVYGMVDEHNWEGDEIGLAATLLVPIVLLLSPAVRKSYWNSATT